MTKLSLSTLLTSASLAKLDQVQSLISGPPVPPADKSPAHQQLTPPNVSADIQTQKSVPSSSARTQWRSPRPAHTSVTKSKHVSHHKTEAQQWLQATWPELFYTMPIKPLKLNIQDDILQHQPAQFSKTRLRQALSGYVNRKAYLKAIIQAEQRYDLTGQGCEPVTIAQKLYSQQRLDYKLQQASDNNQVPSPQSKSIIDLPNDDHDAVTASPDQTSQ